MAFLVGLLTLLTWFDEDEEEDEDFCVDDGSRVDPGPVFLRLLDG